MNRTDRLHALTEELRRAGPAGRTAARLAARLEVSARTVKRDVAALQQAGLPVWAQAGPGGGYVLDAAATLPPVNLTAAQALAVAVALAANPDAPYSADGRAALEKVLDVMPAEERDRAEQLGTRVWLRGTANRPRPLRAVDDGLARGRVVVLTYRDRAGRRSRRRVEPHLLISTHEAWYLVGWCRLREAPRWFRLDRIEAASGTREPVTHRDLAVFGVPPPDAHPLRPADLGSGAGSVPTAGQRLSRRRSP